MNSLEHAPPAHTLKKIDIEARMASRVAAATPNTNRNSATTDRFDRHTRQDFFQPQDRLPTWRWTAQVLLVLMILSALELARVTLRSTLLEWHEDTRTSRDPLLVYPLSGYECVSWTETSSCSAGRTDLRIRACNETILTQQTAGFCELRHRTTGELKRVMHVTCDADVLVPGVTFKCTDYYAYLSLGQAASTYEFDPSFSYQQSLQYVKHRHGPAMASSGSMKLEQGIAFVADERAVVSVYASIRSLRRMGCVLPIELWHSANETIRKNRLVQELATRFGVYLRQIKDPRFFGSESRSYAALYSAFDKVLIMEPGIFATNDPTYLFSNANFTRQGAIFWPAYPSSGKPAPNKLDSASFIWSALDVGNPQTAKQETGHVLINRQRNYKALNALMYFVLHADQLESLRVFRSDSDFFRLAWLVAKSPFHVVGTPAGNAGTALPEKGLFCGGSVVQHDFQGQMLFVRRSQQPHWQDKTLWKHIYEVKADSQSHGYRSPQRGGNKDQLLEGKGCFELGRTPQQRHGDTLISEFPFADMEEPILRYFEEAAKLATIARADRYKLIAT